MIITINNINNNHQMFLADTEHEFNKDLFGAVGRAVKCL